MNGISYFLSGFELITKPKILPFVLIPFLINLLLFSGLIFYAWHQYESLMLWVNNQLPSWLVWLEWLLIPLFVLMALIVVFFTFTIVANIVGSPFNGLLAEAVENRLTGEPLPPNTLVEIVKDVPRLVWAELQKIGYYLRWLIPLFLLSFIPIVNLVMPLLWLIFGAWMMVIQYADYPMGNHALSPPAQRQLLAERRVLSLSFGVSVLVGTMIPLVNLLVMPVAVAGATHLWVKEFRNRPQ